MRHFSHELKSVLRDHLFLLLTPMLVIAGFLFVWRDEWTVAITPPGAVPDLGFVLIRSLTLPAWPFVEKVALFGGWIIPFLVLKTADSHDPLAVWKTRPVSRPVVFLSRFLALAFAYVVLPAAVTWLVCHLSWPEIAVGQAVKIAGAGTGMVLLGAFAAMVAPGWKGVGVLAGLSALVLSIVTFGPDIMQWILIRHILHVVPGRDHSSKYDEYATLSGEAMWWAALVLMAVIMIPWFSFRIPKGRTRPRIWPWFGVTLFLGIGFQSMLFFSPWRKTSMSGPALAVMKIELEPAKKPTFSRSHFGAEISLGVGQIRLPDIDLRMAIDADFYRRIWVSDERSHALMTGEWSTDVLGGRIESQFKSSRVGLIANWWENEWGGVPNKRCDWSMTDQGLFEMASILDVPVVKIWTAENCFKIWSSANPVSPVFSWIDTKRFRQKGALVDFDFGIPIGDIKPGEVPCPIRAKEDFQGKTVRFRVAMQLLRDLPPIVWLRVPTLRGGEKITDRETVRIEPADATDRRFYAEGFHCREPRLNCLPRMYFPPRNERKEWLLFNAARGEGVFLFDSYGNYDGKFALELPKNAPPLTDEWIAGSEIVVLKYRSEPVALPVEGVLKVPKE